MKKGIDSMARPIGIKKVRDLEGCPVISGIYGKELILDCYLCSTEKFNRRDLRKFLKKLVKILDMEAGTLHFWDDVGVPKNEKQTKLETTGTSAIQFILTSNITVHCLDLLERVYINIFSCKDFDTGDAKAFVQEWFNSKSIREHVVYRN